MTYKITRLQVDVAWRILAPPLRLHPLQTAGGPVRPARRFSIRTSSRAATPTSWYAAIPPPESRAVLRHAGGLLPGNGRRSSARPDLLLQGLQAAAMVLDLRRQRRHSPAPPGRACSPCRSGSTMLRAMSVTRIRSSAASDLHPSQDSLVQQSYYPYARKTGFEAGGRTRVGWG
jgi:hypothetical protein